MIFKSISIKNFRNFKDICVELANKNVIFGLNDIGKTNFLHAIRFIFDKKVRKNGFLDSDYHKKDTSTVIEITVAIDISDENDSNNQKLRARARGAVLSNCNDFYIKLIATYDQKELLGSPTLYWGSDVDHLKEMEQRGYMYELDYIFNVIYIDAYIDMYSLFRQNTNLLVNLDQVKDKETLEDINKSISDLNTEIASLSGVTSFEKTITPKYNKFRNENISVSIKSEISVKGFFTNIIPYIKDDSDSNLYPTSGEGRKKLLSYSIFEILSELSENIKINLFLIEEPENHLHRSLQIALSNILFSKDQYSFLFLTTHSPYILYSMDKVQLIRIHNCKTEISSSSLLYTVSEKTKNIIRLLNKNLSEALFSNNVLLVEGPSEVLLFEKILSSIKPDYESQGNFILSVHGVGFEKYISIFKKLNINYIIKTDNDFRKDPKTEKYTNFSFQRCNKSIGLDKLAIHEFDDNEIETRRLLFANYKTDLEYINNNYHIYLSEVDLENDLDKCIHKKLCDYLESDSPIKTLQKSKQFMMSELITHLTDDDCNIIFNDKNFCCLQDFIK